MSTTEHTCPAPSRAPQRRRRASPQRSFLTQVPATLLICLISAGLPTTNGRSVCRADESPTEVNSAAGTPPATKSPASKSDAQDPTDKIAPKVSPEPVIDLLANSIDKTWEHFSSKKGTKLKNVWQISKVGQDRHLICKGEPKGFLYTQQEYSNFELTFEWMYPTDPNGNSGVLIYTRKEPRLWPTSIQVQLHQPDAGALFASGDATSDKPFDAGVMAKPAEWNKCRIVSQGGLLSVEINGQKAGQTEGCKPECGFIGLQSEGSETHFRKLILKPLPTTPSSKPAEKVTTESKATPVPSDAG